jgi:ATP-dependent DNA helicase 2 subunit 2
MGEVYYIWADINSAREQIAFSSIVKAMINKEMVAVIRMTNRDGAEAKMGIAMPRRLDEIDCLLWVQVCQYETQVNCA